MRKAIKNEEKYTLCKGAIALLLGFMAIIALDCVWASKGYAQEQRYCEKLDGTIIIVSAPLLCPAGTMEV